MHTLTRTYTTAAVLSATLLATALTGCGSKDNANTSQDAPVTKTVYDTPTPPSEKTTQTPRTHKQPHTTPKHTKMGHYYVCVGLVIHIAEFQLRPLRGHNSFIVSPEYDADAVASSSYVFKDDRAGAKVLLTKLYTMGSHSKEAISAIRAYCGDANYKKITKMETEHIKNRNFDEDFVPDWVGH